MPLLGDNRLITRVTREGWPLMTFETEVNGDLKSADERGPFLVGSLGPSCRYKRLLSCYGQPIQNNFSSPHTTFIYVPIAQQPGQVVMQCCLSLKVCLR